MIQKTCLLVFSIWLLSCSGTKQETPDQTPSQDMEMQMETKYTPDMVVNEKDYTCGMPTSAGISDTCHYQGKAYGFCSAECMAEFKKNPEQYLPKQ
jgi:YHS domain-containing protein